MFIIQLLLGSSFVFTSNLKRIFSFNFGKSTFDKVFCWLGHRKMSLYYPWIGQQGSKYTSYWRTLLMICFRFNWRCEYRSFEFWCLKKITLPCLETDVTFWDLKVFFRKLLVSQLNVFYLQKVSVCCTLRLE